MRIVYVGKKPAQECIAGSGVPWVCGEVREIEDIEACKRLLHHTDSWSIAPAVEAVIEGNSWSVSAEGVFTAENVELTDAAAAALAAAADLQSLRDECTARGIKFHPNAKADALRKKIAEAAQ